MKAKFVIVFASLIMQKLKSLSIFFPCYNDRFTLSSVVTKAVATAKKVSRNFEILIIENGSTDDSLTVARNLEKKYHEVKVIHFTKPLGYGGALREGFRLATKDFIFYTDTDGQYDPAEITKLAQLMTYNIDVVNGYKIIRADNWLRRCLGDLYNHALHLLYPIPIRDIDCDFRLIRKSILSNLTLKTSSAVVCLELIVKLQDNGAKFVEVGVNHFKRQFGDSTFFHLPQLVGTLKDHFLFFLSYRLRLWCLSL